MKFSFRPALLESLRGYSLHSLRADVSAGLTVGIVALPLAMAFAMASGVSPQAGIFTAIIAGFLISALGGSRFQIGGPTGAYIVIVYGIVAEYGLPSLLLCTMASGVLLLIMGAIRLGALIRYIPVCIVIGFTNGIAVLIVLSQVRDFLGLQEALPDKFFARLVAIYENLGHAHGMTVAMATLCFLAIWFWPKAIITSGAVLHAQEGQDIESGHVPIRETHGLLYRVMRHAGKSWRVLLRIPAPLAVLVMASLLAAPLGLMGYHVETIGSRFGGIPGGFPAFQWPGFSLFGMGQLVVPTITIALLGGIESLLSARVADSQTDDRHDPNQELMAQGIANIVVPFFGGIPATGAIARTATNIRAGARTPVSGMVHALVLLAIVLVAAPLASYIPLAALSAILLNVGLNMGDWGAFVQMNRFPVPYRAILVSTFVITVVFDLTLAVEIGLIMASIFFILQVSGHTYLQKLSVEGLPEGVAAYKIVGSLFFGAVGKLEPLMEKMPCPPRIIILEVFQLLDMDETGMDALLSLDKTLRKRGGYLMLCHPDERLLAQMQNTGFSHDFGVNHIAWSMQTAVEWIRSADLQNEKGLAQAVVESLVDTAPDEAQAKTLASPQTDAATGGVGHADTPPSTP